MSSYISLARIMKQRMGEECPNMKLNGRTLEAFRKFYYLNNKIEAKGGTNDSVSATKTEWMESGLVS